MKLGPWELVLILAIVLIIFGVGRLPQIGKAFGKSVGEFRKGQKEEEEVAKAIAEEKDK
jgi:sec-independent protein translocase protein TatA